MVHKLPAFDGFLDKAPDVVLNAGDCVATGAGSAARLGPGSTGWAKAGCVVIAQPGSIIHFPPFRRAYRAEELPGGSVAQANAESWVWGQQSSFLIVEPGAECYIEDGAVLFQ